jgi:hypothetical protein
MPDTGWDRAFDDPITLADGCELLTLRDARQFIAAKPKPERDEPEWRIAGEAFNRKKASRRGGRNG